MNKNNIGKGAAYLYIEAVTMMFSGYVYWLILSKIASPSVIGTASTVVSLVTIFMTFAGVGVAGGGQRFLGKSIVDNKIDNMKIFVNASLLITGLGILGTSTIIFFSKEWINHYFKLDFWVSIILISIMGSSVMSGLFRAIVIPSLKTREITVSSVLSTIIKISLTIILVLLGLNVSGILIGYMFYPIISSIMLVIVIKKTIYKQFKKENNNNNNNNNNYQATNFLDYTREIFIASIAFWIPGIVTTIGSQLGTISIFVSNGADHAGIYFISLSIVTGISLIMSVLSTIAYPIIGSMNDGRKRAVWRLLKISLILTIPISTTLIFYSSDIMQFFGRSYAEGSSDLQILLLSILPTTIVSGISVLVYSYGNNRLVLIIGLFMSIPRTLLYFVFVPIFGGNGAALTYLMGSVIGCIVSIIIAKRTGLKIDWIQVFIISTIPILPGLILKYTNINFIIGILVTLIISYLIFIKLHVINIEDIRDILKVFPKRISDLLIYTITKILNKFGGNKSL